MRRSYARGTIVLETAIAARQALAWVAFVIDEVARVGFRCAPFDQALAAHERGDVRVKPLISEPFDLLRGFDAFAQAKSIPKVGSTSLRSVCLQEPVRLKLERSD